MNRRHFEKSLQIVQDKVVIMSGKLEPNTVLGESKYSPQKVGEARFAVKGNPRSLTQISQGVADIQSLPSSMTRGLWSMWRGLHGGQGGFFYVGMLRKKSMSTGCSPLLRIPNPVHLPIIAADMIPVVIAPLRLIRELSSCSCIIPIVLMMVISSVWFQQHTRSLLAADEMGAVSF